MKLQFSIRVTSTGIMVNTIRLGSMLNQTLIVEIHKINRFFTARGRATNVEGMTEVKVHTINSLLLIFPPTSLLPLCLDRTRCVYRQLSSSPCSPPSWPCSVDINPRSSFSVDFRILVPPSLLCYYDQPSDDFTCKSFYPRLSLDMAQPSIMMFTSMSFLAISLGIFVKIRLTLFVGSIG